MASTFTSIAHTGITVQSLDDALTFWVELLGFSPERRLHLDREFAERATGVTSAIVEAAVVTLGGQAIELLEYTSPTDRSVFRPRPCNVGSVHLALNVTNMDDAVAGAGPRAGIPLGGAGRPTRRHGVHLPLRSSLGNARVHRVRIPLRVTPIEPTNQVGDGGARAARDPSLSWGV